MKLEETEIIDFVKTAELLGLSVASVRNWIRHGFLSPVDEKGRLFIKDDVMKLKEDISQGKIDRQRKRANKIRADRFFLPSEYLKNDGSRREISRLIKVIKQHDFDNNLVILVLAINLFRKNKDIYSDDLTEILAFRPETFRRKAVFIELRDFYAEIKQERKQPLERSDLELMEQIFHYSVPDEKDLPGIVYQSLTREDRKSGLGSYFTPAEIVDTMVRDNIQQSQKVLDPCCGTGQFLLAFSRYIENPENIYGMDIDPTVVRIARFNLLLAYPQDFTPRIYHSDTLEDDQQENIYDFLATNPPWGAEISQDALQQLKTSYPEITSGESCSYFIRAGLSVLKEGGTFSLILPESVLNIHAHSDIRKYILNNCLLKKIKYLGKVFKNVLSPVIRLDLIKALPTGMDEVQVILPREKYTVSQQRFLRNKWYIIDIFLTPLDRQLMQKVYGTEHITLKGRADWALGIVTGDNKKYLTKKTPTTAKDIYEPVCVGIDVDYFRLKDRKTYIKFSPEKFQQVAPIEKYKASEKLIYRFISATPVFAYDDTGSLTLNSANILIPHPDYPLKVILALFNSSLYSFIYSRKFHSIRILRGDLEQLPLPLWKQEVFDHITLLVERIINGENIFPVLDNYLFDQFGYSEEEKTYILSRCIRKFQGRKIFSNLASIL